MMNVLEVQDNLKNFSEQQLVKEMQQPSGSTPQFLVLSELNRRKRVKGDFEARQAQNQPTVAEEAVASAGVPQSGMMGMPEAMAPQSAVSEGVGTSAPMKMASGGLAQFGNEIREGMGQEIDPYLDGVQQEAESKFNIDLNNNDMRAKKIAHRGPQSGGTMAPIQQLPGPRIPTFNPGFNSGMGGKGMPRPAVMPSIALRDVRNIPFGARGFAEGGVIRAKDGEYFPSSNELYGIYGQESGFGKNLFGSAGEIGPYQILPTTAISPGYGIQSLFPELAQAVAQGKYKDFNEAYLDNKDAVDSVLMSGEKTEPFVKSYLDAAENKLGSRDKALLSYNQGIAGTKNFNEDASKTNYVSGIMSNMQGFDGAKMSRPTFTDGDVKKTKVSGTTTTTSNVPKGVRPDFTIDSIPKNIREQKYLQELIKQRDVGKQQKRPILSDIINKEIEKEKDNQKPSILEEKLKPLGFPPFPDPYAQNRDAQIAGLGGRSNQDVYSDGYGIFTDVDPLENIKSKTIKENVTKDLIEQNKMPNVKKVGGSDDAVTKKILQNLGPSQESLNQISNEDAFIGSDIPIVDELRSQVTDNSNKVTEKPKSQKKDTTSLTSLEQELLNRQNQMKKDRDFDKYMALAQAGLSIMSSDKPTLAGAIGEGGTAGLEAFRGAQKRYQEGLNDILNARVKLAGKKGGLSQKEAISSIASIDSAIAKYRTDADKAVDPAAITKIQDAIAQLNFQKRSLMPIAGYSYLNTDVSDTTAAKG